MTDKTQSVTVDGISIEVTPQGAQVISKLQKTLSDSADRFEREIAAKDATIAEKDRALATKDAELEKVRKDVPDQAAMDAAVEARAQLVSDAKAIDPTVEPKGLSDADLRKAVVTKALGDAAVAGKPQAYIDARFDILVEEKSQSASFDGALSTSLANPRTAVGDAAAHDTAYGNSVQDLNAWRNKA